MDRALSIYKAGKFEADIRFFFKIGCLFEAEGIAGVRWFVDVYQPGDKRSI